MSDSYIDREEWHRELATGGEADTDLLMEGRAVESGLFADLDDLVGINIRAFVILAV